MAGDNNPTPTSSNPSDPPSPAPSTAGDVSTPTPFSPFDITRRSSLSFDPLQLGGPISSQPTASATTRAAMAAATPSATATSSATSQGGSGNTFTINGTTFKCSKNPDVQVKTACLNRKEDRANLAPDVKRDLITEATKKVLPKFQVLSATKLTQANKGDGKDSSALEMEASLTHLVAATRERHMMFDLHDVFDVVFPKDAKDPVNGCDLYTDASGAPRTIDLYRQFTQVTMSQVAVSCYWYNTWVSPTHQPWVRENMQITYNQLSAHVAVELHNKILETYTKFDVSYRGGPLYFKILMDHLVSNFEQVAESLIKYITDHKISSQQGEDVSKTVTLLRTATDRLHSIQRLPNNISAIILRVYQTSSVPEFNEVFKHLELNRSIFNTDSAMTPHQNLLSDPLVTVQTQDTLLQTCEAWNSLAERKYIELKYEGTWWIGKNQKDQSAFNASGKVKAFKASQLTKKCCWNCGEEGHDLRQCPKPKNDAQIEANRKAFKKAKDKSNGSSNGKDGKFAPPAKGESNRREIDGKPMYYHFKSKRWLPSTQLASTQEGDAQSSDSPPSDSGPTSDTPPVNATLAAYTQKFGTMMRDLQQELKKE